MAAIVQDQPERRADASLLQQVVDGLETLNRKFFIGNGDPPIIVQIANLQSCQRNQGGDMEDIRGQLREITRTLNVALPIIKNITDAWKYIGVALLLSFLIGTGVLIWALITHQLSLVPMSITSTVVP